MDGFKNSPGEFFRLPMCLQFTHIQIQTVWITWIMTRLCSFKFIINNETSKKDGAQLLLCNDTPMSLCGVPNDLIFFGKYMHSCLISVLYCKSGNFRATLIFTLFVHFWASAKWKHVKVFILCVDLCRMAEKHKFKNKQKCQKLLKRKNLHAQKLPL